MGKTDQNTLPRKRKLSANNSEEKPNKKIKKLKNNGKNKRTESKESTIVDVKLSDNNDTRNSAKKVAKEGKSKVQTTKAKKTRRSTKEKCSDKSVSHESSDEQLPLSEILKRSKAEQNVKEKLHIKSKTKKSLSLSQIGNKVEGEVKIVKSNTGLGRNTMKKETNVVPSHAKEKSFKANINKTSNKDVKINPSKKEECKASLPVKPKRNAKDFEDTQEKSLVKHEGLSPVKTKKKISVNKEETEGHDPSVKEMIRERNVVGNVEESDDEGEDGDESDMDWEDVAGNCFIKANLSSLELKKASFFPKLFFFIL